MALFGTDYNLHEAVYGIGTSSLHAAEPRSAASFDAAVRYCVRAKPWSVATRAR